MPFTASHIAAVLPLSRTPLVASALAIGSMVPDAPLFVGGRPVDYWTTHSFAGAATYDALLGFAVFVVWHLVFAPAIVATLPADVQQAVVRSTPLGLGRRICSVRKCLLLYVSLVVGALTHVVWDAFTHGGRWGVELVPWLAAEHGRFDGHEYAQHGSSLIGALVVAWWCFRWLRRNGIAVAALRLGRGAQMACVAVVLAATAAVALVLLPLIAGSGARRLDDAAFLIATTAIPAGALCALLLAVGWHVLRLRRRSTRATASVVA